MKHHFIAYSITLVTIILLDAMWLSLMAPVYQKKLAHLMADTVKLWPIIMFYPLYAFGLYFLVIRTNLTASLGLIFVSGLILGLVAYGTYDLTNNATLKGWPVVVTCVDMIWGGFITGAAAFITVWVLRRFAL